MGCGTLAIGRCFNPFSRALIKGLPFKKEKKIRELNGGQEGRLGGPTSKKQKQEATRKKKTNNQSLKTRYFIMCLGRKA